jgi:hypothetical protein
LVSDPPNDDVREFGRLFERFLTEIVHASAGDPGTSLADRLERHLGVDPSTLPVVTMSFALYDHVNLQAALDVWFAEPGRAVELIGVAGSGRMHQSLTELLEMSRRHSAFGVGPVDYTRLAVSPTEQRDVVQFGIYLVADGDERLALLVRGPSPHSDPSLAIEVLATSTAASDKVFTDLPALMAKHNVFRGQVISLSPGGFGPSAGPISFHARPTVQRSDVILPPGTLDLVERQIVGIGRHQERLSAAGQHLKRGVLLYGPPGTGKTHTVRHLISRMSDYTVVLLAGQAVAMVSAACSLAKRLQPALVVLEDCDLVAMERSFGPMGSNPLLFEVLDQMDGLDSDADVAFLLTSNRADLLEPALAQRPGRIDVGVEIGLPDGRARAQLFALYGDGLDLDDATRARVVERTAGVTASFLKELVRRTYLIAAEADRPGPTAEDLDVALDEMLDAADRLGRALVGGSGSDGHDPDDHGPAGGAVPAAMAYGAMPARYPGGWASFGG